MVEDQQRQPASRPSAQQPAWRQGFDALERQVSPRLEAALRSEQFAVAVGLGARVQRLVQQQASRSTRRVLHQLNLPAGTDVSRILNELGRLQRQVRELTDQLDEARASMVAAPKAGSSSRSLGGKEGSRGTTARSQRSGRARPAGR